MKSDISDMSGRNREYNISLMELGKLNWIQLEFGEGGRLGKGGHNENHENRP